MKVAPSSTIAEEIRRRPRNVSMGALTRNRLRGAVGPTGTAETSCSSVLGPGTEVAIGLGPRWEWSGDRRESTRRFTWRPGDAGSPGRAWIHHLSLIHISEPTR